MEKRDPLRLEEETPHGRRKLEYAVSIAVLKLLTYLDVDQPLTVGRLFWIVS